MATKKLTKEEIRNPDFFLTHGHHFAEFMQKHQSFILSLILTVFGAGVIWLGWTYWHVHMEESAGNAIYPVEKSIHDQVEKTKAVTAAALGDYEKQLRDHSDTKAAMISLISVTPDLLRAGKASMAASWFKTLSISPSEDEIGFGLMKMTNALVLLENHQPDEALKIYGEILASPGQRSFFPEAILKMGVAFEAKNDMAKAREMFEKVRREHPTTQAGELALQYLLYLDQKKGA